jgi:hypothetical protein
MKHLQPWPRNSKNGTLFSSKRSTLTSLEITFIRKLLGFSRLVLVFGGSNRREINVKETGLSVSFQQDIIVKAIVEVQMVEPILCNSLRLCCTFVWALQYSVVTVCLQNSVQLCQRLDKLQLYLFETSSIVALYKT